MVVLKLAENVPQLPVGREFPDELLTENCFSKYKFSVNEAPKPDLRAACCVALNGEYSS